MAGTPAASRGGGVTVCVWEFRDKILLRGDECTTPKNLKFSKSIKLNNKLLKWLREA